MARTVYRAPLDTWPGPSQQGAALSISAMGVTTTVELRHYLDVLKRHRWLIIQGIVLVGLIAGLVSGLQTPVYKAGARVLLRPNDSSESLYPGYGNASLFNDPDRYVSAQEDIIQSEAVAREAAKSLGGTDAETLLSHVSVAQSGTTDVLEISSTDIDPTRARDVANAFAKAYIENRKQFAVGSLKNASDQVQVKLDELQGRIAQLNSQIGDGGIKAGDVLVLMCRGPMGSGMEEIFEITCALRYLDFGKHVTVVTDARFSGVSTGACIGHVTPEALAGGPLGKIREGDLIEVRDGSRNHIGLLETVQRPDRDVPEYLAVDYKAFKGQFVRTPKMADVPYPVQMEPNLVIEFYSR